MGEMIEPPGEYWRTQFAEQRRYWELFHADEDTGDLEYAVYEFQCDHDVRPCLWDSHMELDQGYEQAIDHERTTGHRVVGRPMLRHPAKFRTLEE